MSTEGWLALAFGVALGTFLTAALLWLHERGQRRALQEVGVRLRRSEARAHAMLRDSHDIIAVVDPAGKLSYASPAAERLFGRRVAPLVGSSPFEFVHPEDRDRVLTAFATALSQPGETEQVEMRVQHQNGQWRQLEAVGTNLVDDPAIAGMVVTARDVSERRRADAALREAQLRFRAAFDHAPIGMALTSMDGRLMKVNRAFARMLGRPEDRLEGMTVLELTHPDDRDDTAQTMRSAKAAGNGAPYRLDKRYLHADGRPVWVQLSGSVVRDVDHTPLYFVSQIEDVTEKRASGELMAHQALHDPLTGLPNRTLFADRLRRALTDTEEGSRVAVLFLDLDHFKVINESLGHPAGDRLLTAVGDHLRAALRPMDVVARFGGDEFGVLCTGVPDEQTAYVLATRVLDAVARPITLSEGEVFVTASVGIALSGGELETPETLLRNADTAMYRAKDAGRSRAELFMTGSHAEVVRHLRTGNDLHRALERGELLMHYQPLVRLEDGAVTGFEALLRWQHPERGLVRPDDFVGLAEQTGLVVPIGMWALEESCRQITEWNAGGASFTMSVNLSLRQLAEPGLPREVARVLGETGVRPDSVWLEITESTLMSDAESTVRSLTALRSLGVHLAVDDFGTGYSSMTYLKRFPVEALKVDRSFVDGLGRDAEDSAICTAIVTLAHSLGLKAVAEGVETPEQLAELRTLGCELAQGYLFGHPVPAEHYGTRPDLRVWADMSVS